MKFVAIAIAILLAADNGNPRVIQNTSAFIGRGGEVFFYGTAPADDELGTFVAGTPVLHDSRGRLWCTANGNSIGADGDTIAPPPGAFFNTFDLTDGLSRPRITGYEDSRGRVWFGHSRGVVWRDGAGWHAKDLAEPNDIEVRRPMSAPLFAEDSAGRVYIWARWPAVLQDGSRMFTREPNCGTKGFWLFDGADWRQFTSADGLPLDRVEAVIPLGHDAALVNLSDGRLVEFKFAKVDAPAEIARLLPLLEDKRWQTREDATRSLIALGRDAINHLKQLQTDKLPPETRSRIKLALDDIIRSPHDVQSFLGKRYACERIFVRTPRRTNAKDDTPVLVFAENVFDTQTNTIHQKGVFIYDDEAARLIAGWPQTERAAQITLVREGGGMWFAIESVGLFRWDGERIEEIPVGRERGFSIIIGRNTRGKIIISNGTDVAEFK